MPARVRLMLVPAKKSNPVTPATAKKKSSKKTAVEGGKKRWKPTGSSGVTEAILPSALKPEKPKPNDLRIVSWNINGIRSVFKKGLSDWFKGEDADIVCLQEVKAQRDQVLDEPTAVHVMHAPGFKDTWHSAEKKGYSGVATWTKIGPLREWIGFEADDADKNFNAEGRIVVQEYQEFFLWNVYFPNGQRGPDRVRYKIEFYEKCLGLWEQERLSKPVIICGDFNTAHTEIDLARPKENASTSGFLPEERAFLDKMAQMGYVDTFRLFNKEPGWYSYWDSMTFARQRDVGWRIDYFWVTKEIVPRIAAAYIERDVKGSDHCPVGIIVSAL